MLRPAKRAEALAVVGQRARRALRKAMERSRCYRKQAGKSWVASLDVVAESDDQAARQSDEGEVGGAADVSLVGGCAQHLQSRKLAHWPQLTTGPAPPKYSQQLHRLYRRRRLQLPSQIGALNKVPLELGGGAVWTLSGTTPTPAKAHALQARLHANLQMQAQVATAGLVAVPRVGVALDPAGVAMPATVPVANLGALLANLGLVNLQELDEGKMVQVSSW